MQKQRGFTLIELLIVLAIVAIMLSLAAPSFKRMIQSNAISSSVNGFLADMRYARSESIRLGGNVVMCRSDTPDSAAPSCGAGTGGGKGWMTGWIIFHDKSVPPNAAFDAATDTVLRVQSAMKSPDAALDNPSSTVFRFTATGRMQSATSAAAITFGGTPYDTSVKRVVCISLGGRARVAGDGTTSCGASSE